MDMDLRYGPLHNQDFAPAEDIVETVDHIDLWLKAPENLSGTLYKVLIS